MIQFVQQLVTLRQAAGLSQEQGHAITYFTPGCVKVGKGHHRP